MISRLINKIRRFFWRKKEEPRTLTCMRLDEMFRVHPQQIESTCSACGAVVGIYPSGQKILMDHPDTRVVCNHCGSPFGVLAPGATEEMRESKFR